MLMFYAALRGGNSQAQVAGNATYIDTYNGDTSATLGSHQVGDIFIACASRDNSSAAPTIPSGQNWTTILTAGANTLGASFVYKVATSTSEATGIFTSATSLQVVHIRPTTGWTAGIGGNNTASSSSSVALSTPAVTMTNTDGTSRVVAFYMHRNADIAGLTTAPTNLTHGRTNQDATDTMASYYTADVVSSFTSQTSGFTGTASACRWVAVEVTLANSGDTTPNAFTFTDQTDVALSSTITSAAVSISGITAQATITVTGGEYDIGLSGLFTSASGTVNNGDTVRARHTSSGSNSTATNTIITIGGVSDTFTSTTAALDTTPDAFSFVDQTGVALSSTVTSAPITVSGITAPATITVTGGTYDINASGTFGSGSSTVNNGNTVRARHTSSANNSTDTSTTITIGGVSDTFTSTTLAASGAWQLASGHWIPRKKNMVIIHPRPSGESASWAQYKNAHTGTPWSTHIAVGGGAWPLRFELAAGPSGMTIGSEMVLSGGVLVPPSDYGEVKWDNPTAGSHTVTVNVYDQDYQRGANPSAVATITWTLIVGTSQHVFIDPVNGSDSYDGSLGTPFRTIQKLHNDSSATGTYNGRTVWLMNGTHNLDGMATNGNRYAMVAGGAPVIFVGYPGHSAILNMYEGFAVFNTGGSDAMFKDLQIQSAGDWTDDQYFFTNAAVSNRHSWHNVTFTNFYGGSGTGANNQAAIYYSNIGVQYVSLIKCTFTGRMGCILDGYNVTDCVFERCTGTSLNTTAEENASNSHELIYMKDGCIRWTIRGNTFVTSMGSVAHGSFAGCGGQNNSGQPYSFNDIEICYNKLAMFANASLRGYYEYGDGPVGSVYGYRNSTLGNITDFVDSHNQGPTPNVWENNVALTTISGLWSPTLTNNTTGAGTLDSSGNLSGTTRTNYLGQRGAEIV